MKKIFRILLAWLPVLLSLLTIGYLIHPMVTKYLPSFLGNYSINATYRTLLVAASIIFTIVLWIAKTFLSSEVKEKPESDKKNNLVPFIVSSMATLFLFVAAVNIVIDPWDLYGIKVFPSRENPARRVKLEFYEQRTTSPNIIVTGSSAAFPLAPQYFEEQLNLEAFNWSFNNGALLEIANVLRYVEDHPGGMPEVIIVQVTESDRFTKKYDQANFQLLHYLPPGDLIQEIGTRVSDAVSINQLTESLYTFGKVKIQGVDTLHRYYFLEDGERYYADLSFDEKGVAVQLRRASSCTEFPDTLTKGLKEIIDIANEHHSSIVLYLSPVYPQAYEHYLADNAQFQVCHNVIIDYLADTAEDHNNVYFHDFTFIESMNGIAEQYGFMDAYHITPENAEIMIDAMSETIMDAYKTAQEMRNNEGGAE